MMRHALLLSMAAVPAIGQDTQWEVRYALPTDQKPEWTEAGYLPQWTVTFTDRERPTVELTGDDGGGLFRGQVLVGKRMLVPDPLPAELRVGFRYQTYCEIGNENMQRSGYVGMGIFTPEAFDALADEPADAQVVDLRAIEGSISAQQIQFSGEDVLEWRPWESRNLAPQLRPHAGGELIFAMIWGGYHYSDEEWGKLDGWEVRTMSQEEADRRFWEALDLQRPDLSAVRDAVAAGDMDAAEEALADHFRAREEPPGPELTTTASKAVVDRADEICEHIYRFVGCPPFQLGEVIQWNEDPYNYDQWAIALNRHGEWRTLGQAYAATGDEKYAREFVALLTSWTEAMPVHIGPRWIQGPYFEDGKSPLTLDAGIRMGQSWFPAYYYFRSSPEFHTKAQVAMLRSFRQHALHLMDDQYYHETSNWGTMEANGLLHIGLMLPEFRDARLWADTAARRLLDQQAAQVYPDGAQTELAPGYHGVTLYNMIWGMKAARRVGYEMPEGFEAGLERMYDYHARISMPNGRMPALNDSGWGSATSKLLDGLAAFPERRDWEYVATFGERGDPPGHTSTHLPYAGWYMMRSGWGRDDSYMLLDAGPFGTGHQHEDKLHIILHARRKTLLSEPGTYAYDTSDWRRYAISARAHNTVMVDGLEQTRRGTRGTSHSEEPLTNPWVTGGDFDYAEGSYEDGYGPAHDKTVTHTRKVLFVKPDYWVVVDVLSPADGGPHTYDSLFHLDVDEASVDAETLTVTGTSGEAQLAIIPLDPEGLSIEIVEGQTEPVVQGWIPTGRHDELRPIPTPTYHAEGAGTVVMAYALVPGEAGAELPVVERLVALDGTLVVALRWSDGRVHHFTYNPNAAALQVGPAETSAPVAFVSVDAAGNIEQVFEYAP